MNPIKPALAPLEELKAYLTAASPMRMPVLNLSGPVATLEVSYRGETLDAAGRTTLLERVRGGEVLELEFTATTFVQSAEPNRNFLRFKPSVLTRVGKSFKGAPFLRDHDQHSLLARGGTVIESQVELDDGVTAFVMRIKASKPWAVEGVLDGTIDRFSIGWHPTGDVLCSQHKTPVFKDCACWPGDRIGDTDEHVEFIFTAAEGVEVSGVNVPAVTGTGVDNIRAALAAINDKQGEQAMANRLCAKLGLPEAATEDDGLTALDRFMGDHRRTTAELEATRERLKLSEGKLAEYEADRQRLQIEQVGREIDRLYESGRLPVARDAAGKRVPHQLETALLKMADTLGYDAFKSYIDTLPRVAPVGPGALQSGGVTEKSGPPAELSVIEKTALRFNVPADTLRRTLSKMNISEEKLAKFGPQLASEEG